MKKDGTATTPTLYWTGTGSDPLAESDLSGTVNEEFIFLNGKRIARVDVAGPGAPVHYYFSDHLGSADVITNTDGSVIEEESVYYPFGGELAILGGPNHFKFTGKERDPETGLDYFLARHYASDKGRFLQPDEFTGGPVDAFSSNDPAPPGPTFYADLTNPQSLNKYAYTYNNPLRYTDPDGHCAVACFAAIGAVAGGVISGGGSLYFDWKDGRPLDFQRAGKEALKGAVAGAIVGATLGHLAPDSNQEGPSPKGSDPQPSGSESKQSDQGNNAQQQKESGGTGTIYRVPGEGTESGKPYVGMHNKPDPAKTRRSNDGRDRTKAEVVDTYNAANKQEGRVKEQQQIDKAGLPNLDNKRNEIRKDK